MRERGTQRGNERTRARVTQRACRNARPALPETIYTTNFAGLFKLFSASIWMWLNIEKIDTVKIKMKKLYDVNQNVSDQTY